MPPSVILLCECFIVEDLWKKMVNLNSLILLLLPPPNSEFYYKNVSEQLDLTAIFICPYKTGGIMSCPLSICLSFC